MFKNFFRDFFAFNRAEKRAIVIFTIPVILIIVWLYVSRFVLVQPPADFTQHQIALNKLRPKQFYKDTSAAEKENNYAENDYKLPSGYKKSGTILFKFNPNNLSASDWKKLGLTDKQIKTIKNYETKGGKFRKKEDVKKMYCITPAMYEKLEPYIDIPIEPISQNTKTDYTKTEPVNKKLDINTADSTELIKLKGIGSFLSKGIVKYRNLLGGYTNIDQLKEVYGFKPETLDEIKDLISLNTNNIKKININIASYDEFKRHPYIKINLAKLIISYRNMHGKFTAVEDVKKIETLTTDVYLKLAPYLTIAE
jgi:competence ComEA-like helix-hairpin-helix protein